ncbi:iron ABC transporter permease [Myxococcota bacterium]|nr:iron ABC transporter permease [Myxococcota bacterium]MBU1430742.1 iron ABC transporter permease [Myxococcota bacterium]MBU1897144.1 iron ABC transporter permease [Myxococcota bacterium]
MRPRALLLALLTALLLALGLAVAVGATPLSPQVILDALLGQLKPDTVEAIIFWELRAPRAVMGALVGAALALSGATLQGVFQNPLADPSLLGVSSGAAFGAALALAFGWGGVALPLSAALGAALAGGAVLLLAWRDKRLPLESVLLAGVAVGLVLASGLSVVIFLAGEGADEVILWLMGHLGGNGWQGTRLVALCLLLSAPIPLYYAADLNLFLEGEEVAAALGVAVERVKWALFLSVAVAVGGAVAFTGVIGFVGLVVPHALRGLIGPDHRQLLPASALGGALLLVLADTAARTLAPVELPVGVITGLLGGPLFLWLMRRHAPR